MARGIDAKPQGKSSLARIIIANFIAEASGKPE
jgi:hypothetical protein